MTLSNQDIRLMSKADWGPSTGFPHFPPAPILLQVSLPSISAQHHCRQPTRNTDLQEVPVATTVPFMYSIWNFSDDSHTRYYHYGRGWASI